MGETHLMADSKNAYTLSDMGTYLTYQKRIKLKHCFPRIRSPESVQRDCPESRPVPEVNYREAMISSDLSLRRRAANYPNYKMHGVRLFNPDAVPLRQRQINSKED
jgi:ABC-type tungstate transport system permease subunit